VLRGEIAKPKGGTRKLGIPTVTDRLIQQAMQQVLGPLFDPGFSESSFGFRPGRSAHMAVGQCQRYCDQGYRWVVDMDLEKFFDRVNHDILMSKIARQIKDNRLLGVFEELDSWVRRRLRGIRWRQWKRPSTRFKKLLKRGLPQEQAARSAYNGRGPWWNSGTGHMNLAFPKSYFERLNLVSLARTVSGSDWLK